MKIQYFTVTRLCFIHYLLVVLILVYSPIAKAEGRAMTIKVAQAAPKGSIYHRVLQEVGAEWREAQGSNSKFIIYSGGSQGTESNTIRRMRIGQLDASMLTVAGLKEIDESITALQLMPLMFRTWEEFDYVHEQLRPELERKFLEKGFVVLFWGEGGWVQFFSTVPPKTRIKQFNQSLWRLALSEEITGQSKKWYSWQ